MMIRIDGSSSVYIAAQQGHVEVARALMEVGGRERAMLTRNDLEVRRGCTGGCN